MLVDANTLFLKTDASNMLDVYLNPVLQNKVKNMREKWVLKNIYPWLIFSLDDLWMMRDI